MTDELVVGLGREAMLTVLLVAAPVLGLALLAGVVVSVFQATTQINEQTLAFVPKILSVFLAVTLFGPWMFNIVTQFAANLLGNLNSYIR